MIFKDDKGNTLNFTIHLESWSDSLDPNILVESRSGTKGSPKERNGDYNKGLEVLFERLGAYRIVTTKIVVEKTRQNLPEHERILNLKYPIVFHGRSKDELEEIRQNIGNKQARTARTPGSKETGGNSTKCIRIWVKPTGSVWPQEKFILGYDNQSNLSNTETDLDNQEPNLALDSINLEPDHINDERQKTIKSIVCRQGQKDFRENLLKIYGSTCVVSGCNVEEAIDAAHIIPYLGGKTNVIKNGLLLRADIHNLFDLGFIAIHPNDLTVKICSELKSSCYLNFNGKRISRSSTGDDIVSRRSLEWHWNNVWKERPISRP